MTVDCWRRRRNLYFPGRSRKNRRTISSPNYACRKFPAKRNIDNSEAVNNSKTEFMRFYRKITRLCFLFVLHSVIRNRLHLWSIIVYFNRKLSLSLSLSLCLCLFPYLRNIHTILCGVKCTDLVRRVIRCVITCYFRVPWYMMAMLTVSNDLYNIATDGWYIASPAVSCINNTTNDDKNNNKNNTESYIVCLT